MWITFFDAVWRELVINTPDVDKNQRIQKLSEFMTSDMLNPEKSFNLGAHVSQVETFHLAANSSIAAWRQPEKYASKNDWLNTIETEATTLANLALLNSVSDTNLNQLQKLCAALASLAETALATGFDLDPNRLETCFLTLLAGQEGQQLTQEIQNLRALEEDAAMYIPQAPTTSGKTKKSTLRWARILTVDDSGLVRSALKRIFNESGSSLDEAKNGSEAIAKIAEISKYDLILLDLEMPDFDGIQVLEQIRRASQDVVVVMLTSSEDIKKAITTIREGADGYFQKQDLPLGGDRGEFFYALEQAGDYRAGIIARRQLEQLKTDFYSMITHDIRNPANVVELALEQLLDDDQSRLDAHQQKMLQIAAEASKKMLTLVTDYLDYAKIDAGYLKIEAVSTDLTSLIKSSSDLVQVMADEKRQSLTLELPVQLTAVVDEAKIKQVVDNLISNAVKYTAQGGSVKVRLEQKGEFVRFSVQDSGEGIAPENLKLLFEKFSRLPGESHRSKGTGLGLVIVKAIVEGHGGKVWAESKGLGEGSVFQFEIPLKTVG
jgi:signal transduction histidine kinase